MSQTYKLVITNRSSGIPYEPPILEGIQWETERVGSPGKLTFTVVKTDNLGFHEGDPVQFTVLPKEKTYNPNTGQMEVEPDFHGYVFSKHRNKNHHIEVVAYDQIRFLKNKNTYVMEDVRADQILKRIADDYNLATRNLPNTGYVIEKFAMSNQTLHDMIQWALDETVLSTGRLFCLYDDCGYLALREIKKEHTGLVITEETAEDFDYKTSIDGEVYNQIVLVDTSSEDAEPLTVQEDLVNQERWGILTHRVETSGVRNPQQYAKTLLKEYNRVARSLEIIGQVGDMRVRAGTRVGLILYLGDKNAQWDMVVDKATHVFKHCHHTMDLKLIGHEEWYD